MSSSCGGLLSLLVVVGLSTLLAIGGCSCWAMLVLALASSKLLLDSLMGRRSKPAPMDPALKGKGAATESAQGLDSYEDPLRWSFLPSNGVHFANLQQTQDFENDMCSVKCVAMHRPTHEPQREETGDYPYSWHLAGRKRLWEIRIQLRFKRVPTSKIYFGIELSDCAEASAMGRHLKAVLVRAVQSVVGADFYYTDGETPSQVGEGEEAEPPTFVMPLWAFDQFVVSEVGQEPDLTGDLEGVGMRRTEGLKAYVRELKACIEGFSTDKVYTFSIWGVSQFLDCMRWEAKGIIPGMSFPFSRFGLRPPLNIAIYEIPGIYPDKRHLVSRKRYYLSVAMWSMLEPPGADKLRELLGDHVDARKSDSSTKQRRQSPLTRAMDVFACCGGGGRDFKRSLSSGYPPAAAMGG
eukprot:gb/GFBE01042453.1/.p1 GENE.gb/GFBE01042453.1/~~gb/GFBE01042453.1/.p1  ORF type:complete len:408 (+),score=78.47 gb/GFBE01042453.1/:1-1224(+)